MHASRETGEESEGGEQDRPDREQTWNLLDEMGGPQGVADSSLPGLLFVIAYTVSGGDLSLSALLAVALGGGLAVVRRIRGESLRFAITGFFGVAIAAFIATRTGRAEDFFLPGLLFNAGYALAYAVSIAIGWPLIGVIVGPIIGQGMRWRDDPQQVSAYRRASWVWVGMFLLRLSVQLPLYLAGSLLALGIARTAMGLPLFLLCLWVTWLVLRRGGLDLPDFRRGSSG
ncbi:MAG: DUF3159 domain-containing protein [Solirubrobacterales bacterium]